MRFKKDSIWKGKYLKSEIDIDNKKSILMLGSKSVLCFPIKLEEKSIYSFDFELKKESGNGILHCCIVENSNVKFINFVCDNHEWSIFNMFIDVEGLDSASLFFVFCRNGAIGNLSIGNISIMKIEKTNDEIENLIKIDNKIEPIVNEDDTCFKYIPKWELEWKEPIIYRSNVCSEKIPEKSLKNCGLSSKVPSFLKTGDIMNFCTYFDSNYLKKGLACYCTLNYFLKESLKTTLFDLH